MWLQYNEHSFVKVVHKIYDIFNSYVLSKYEYGLQ